MSNATELPMLVAVGDTVRIPDGETWAFEGPITLEMFKDGDPVSWNSVSMMEGGTLRLRGREGPTYWKVVPYDSY